MIYDNIIISKIRIYRMYSFIIYIEISSLLILQFIYTIIKLVLEHDTGMIKS